MNIGGAITGRESTCHGTRGSTSEQVWVPTCFGCGKHGHKVNVCPERKQAGQANIKRIVAPYLIPPKYIEGYVGEQKYRMLLDSGADRSVVRPSVVKPNEWLGRTITVKGVHGDRVESPLARAWLHTGSYSIPLTVVAIENAEDKVLIGRDIGPVFNELMLQEICEDSVDESIEAENLICKSVESEGLVGQNCEKKKLVGEIIEAKNLVCQIIESECSVGESKSEEFNEVCERVK